MPMLNSVLLTKVSFCTFLCTELNLEEEMVLLEGDCSLYWAVVKRGNWEEVGLGCGHKASS